jgi:hypothetical protein
MFNNQADGIVYYLQENNQEQREICGSAALREKISGISGKDFIGIRAPIIPGKVLFV